MSETQATQDWRPRWSAMRADFPVGRRFEYLGRPMIVTQLRGYIPSLDLPLVGAHIPEKLPAVIAEYADHQGVIHKHVFEMDAWVALEPASDAALLDRITQRIDAESPNARRSAAPEDER